MPQPSLKRLNNLLILTVGVVAALFMKSETVIRLFVLPVLLLPRFCKRFLRFDTDGVFETIYIAYIFFAQVLSGIFSLYVTTAYYDKLMHLLSGVLSGAIGYVFAKRFSLEEKSVAFLNFFFINVTLSIACLWEFFEFYGDTLLGRNAQRVIETGVKDTMLDIHFALLCCIVYCIVFVIFRRKKRYNISK